VASRNNISQRPDSTRQNKM